MADNQGSKLKKNAWRLLLITLCGSLIYGLPYFRSYVYDAYLDAYNLTNTQMGTFGSIFGFMGACSYLFGGVVADVIKPRILMAVSLILTGLGGILHLFNPSYGMLIFIYFLWGFTSLFAFFPALLKSLRGMANSDEQSKAYGFMDGGRGIANAVHFSLIVVIFAKISKVAGKVAGINGIIIFYSSIIIVLGVLVYIFMKDADTEDSQEDEEGKFSIKDIGKAVKLPAVWMLAIIMLCSYTMCMLFYYFMPYATATMGMTAAAGGMVVVMAQYVRPFASFSGGILADKFGRANFMYVTFGLMFSMTMVLILANKLTPTAFIIVCAVIYFGMYAAYSLVYSMLEESGVDSSVSGTAIGLICTIGYLPEVFCPFMAGKMLDKYGKSGYTMIFIFLATMMVIGAITLTIYKRYIKKLNAAGKISKYC